MGTAVRSDPHGNHSFLVEIDGIARASFQQATGFDSAIQVTNYREGGDNGTTRKLPGTTEHSPLVLRWGVSDDTELYRWHREAVRGNLQRRNGSIVLLDRRGQEVRRWNFFNAWPSKWTGPELNAESNDVAIETLELVHEGLELA